MQLTRRLRAIHRRLHKVQGAFVPKPRRPVLDELVQTLLSQHTSDVNSERAFRDLKARFPAWEDVAGAPVEDVADAIRRGGLAPTKARRIKSILEEVRRREGRLDLVRLEGLPDDEARDYLNALPGVGPKTAACVLAFSMQRASFPVDTHVHRIALRLGVVPPKASADATYRLLEPSIPPEIRYDLHTKLIRHGREICTAQRPRCSDCVLFDLCTAGPQFLASGTAR